MASGGGRTIDSSAVVEMEIIESDESDYEADFSEDRANAAGTGTHSDDKDEDLKGQISKGVADYVWKEGGQRARRAFNVYANIDFLRPYFDVEPHEVRSRLLLSLMPRVPVIAEGRYSKVPRELYGPTMIVFTLIAILLYQMKTSGHTVQEGTLMGTAFATCFGYWFGIASLLWVICYVCNTRIGMIQILNVLGYALFGHCLALFLATVFHPAHSHLFFYTLWLIFGGLSALRMAKLLMSRTSGHSQKLAVCGVVVVLHLLFLLYLHFAYHHVVEDVSEALSGLHQFPHADRPADKFNTHNMDVKADLGREYAKVTMARSLRKQVVEATGASETLVRSGTQLPAGIVRGMANKTAEGVNVLRRVQRGAEGPTKSLLSRVKLDHQDSLVAPLAVNVSDTTYRE